MAAAKLAGPTKKPGVVEEPREVEKKREKSLCPWSPCSLTTHTNTLWVIIGKVASLLKLEFAP